MVDKGLNVKGLKVAVFDWDNTLAESRSTLVYAINQVLPQYGLETWEIVKQKRDNNLSFKDNFPRIFGDKAEEAYAKYTEIYLKEVQKRIHAFPKTQEVLDFFKKNHVAIMVMTNKDRRLLEYELPLLFNPKIFDNIVCGHEAKEDKPFGGHLVWTVKDILKPQDINHKTVWVMGDSPMDSRCAQAAGARPIRIGKPIWGDKDEKSGDICFFDSFVDFYESLLLSNSK